MAQRCGTEPEVEPISNGHIETVASILHLSTNFYQENTDLFQMSDRFIDSHVNDELLKET